MSKRCLAAAVAIVGMIASARAQDYPSRPLTMIVPYPAAGVTAGLARLSAERMKRSLGQTITAEKVGGAAGIIGVGRAVRAVPDGYTSLMGNTETNVVTGAALTLSYDVINDLAPIALLPSYPFLIVTN